MKLLLNRIFQKIIFIILLLVLLKLFVILKNKIIIWPLSRQKKYESMNNNSRERFLGVVGKINGIDIILKYKPGGIYKGETFFTRKKVYALDLCAIYDLNTRFIYIFTG